MGAMFKSPSFRSLALLARAKAPQIEPHEKNDQFGCRHLGKVDLDFNIAVENGGTPLSEIIAPGRRGNLTNCQADRRLTHNCRDH